MSKNKITFIIPSLNRNSLTKSIQSLIDQTNPNWECIIIYDGVDGITFDDDRIKTIKIKKTGTIGPVHGQSGLVRNEGIKKVNTEWIGFLDDDDTLHPDYVNTLYENYSNYDFVIWRMILNDGRVIPGHNNNNIIFGDVGISFCYKNKFNDLLFNTNRDGEDFDFLIKLKSLTNNFITTPEVYYNVNF
jgi:glycosyltransferase involved in cell wall biosynthesis